MVMSIERSGSRAMQLFCQPNSFAVTIYSRRGDYAYMHSPGPRGIYPIYPIYPIAAGTYSPETCRLRSMQLLYPENEELVNVDSHGIRQRIQFDRLQN